MNENDIKKVRRQMLYQIQSDLLESYKNLNDFVRQDSVVFVGDSLTEFFPIHEMLHSRTKLYNRGVRGFSVDDLLTHIDVQCLLLKPKKIFLLIGINNLPNETPQLIVHKIKQLITTIQCELPNTKIYIQSLYPINELIEYENFVNNRKNSDIQLINAGLSQLNNVTYIDMYSHLLNEFNMLAKKYTVDGIHLSIEGYKQVVRIIQPLLEKE